jgi:acyl-CoA reductase-like NAD-dependent aldehyde dehydrogenase
VIGKAETEMMKGLLLQLSGSNPFIIYVDAKANAVASDL